MRIPKSSLYALCAFSLLFSLVTAGSAGAQPDAPRAGSWLFQSLYLSGDPDAGFNKTCLIVYQNGDYHREQRHQYSANGHAEFDWHAPEVFEGKLTNDSLHTLATVLNDPNVIATNGAVGGAVDLWSHVVVNRQGEVMPHDNIEMMTVAISRRGAPQVFELTDFDTARKQSGLRAFLDWVKVVEHDHTQASATSQANNCSPGISQTPGPRREPAGLAGMTFPKAIYTPSAPVPANSPRPKSVAVELLINPDGSVAQVTPQGHPDAQITQTIRDTLSKWKFEPARLLGIPIAKTITLTFNFKRN